LILALLVLWESLKLNVGWGLNGPEAGFFPFWLAVGLLLSSVSIIFTALRSQNRSLQRPFIEREGLVSVSKVALPAFAMVALTDVIGLYPAACVYLFVYMRWIGKHAWITTALISFLVPVVSYFIFDKWFLIPMPRGRWDWLASLY
jgi:hypothetical protein